MEKMSGRKKILEVLGKHPEGLNAAKIREFVTKEHAINEQHIASLLGLLAREGKIRNEGKMGCPHCCFKSVLYKIRLPMSAI